MTLILLLINKKKAHRLPFHRKKDAVIHPPVFFNGSQVAVKTEHKHLGMIPDSKLNFQSHITEATDSKPGELSESFDIYPNMCPGMF